MISIPMMLLAIAVATVPLIVAMRKETKAQDAALRTKAEAESSSSLESAMRREPALVSTMPEAVDELRRSA
ncbi:MAG: hypothetical protein ACRDY3_07530 [Acidimicrobiales bacterium]